MHALRWGDHCWDNLLSSNTLACIFAIDINPQRPVAGLLLAVAAGV
jgi:hypothetical protein